MGSEASMFCWSKNVRLRAQHDKVETQELWNLSREKDYRVELGSLVANVIATVLPTSIGARKSDEEITERKGFSISR